jgi:hypothetical protein
VTSEFFVASASEAVHAPPAFNVQNLPRCLGKVHLSTMTKLLEPAVDSVRALRPEVQDELARLLLQVAGEEQPVILLTPEERADLAEADAEIARGDFATDEQMRAILAKRPCHRQRGYRSAHAPHIAPVARSASGAP